MSIQQLGPVPIFAAVRGEGFISVATLEDGVDLNGDGDTLDPVLQLVDLVTGTVTNTRRAVGTNVGTPAFVGLSGTSTLFLPGFPPLLGLSFNTGVITPGPGVGDAFSFGLSESHQGIDANGDGDSVDIVVNATRSWIATATDASTLWTSLKPRAAGLERPFCVIPSCILLWAKLPVSTSWNAAAR